MPGALAGLRVVEAGGLETLYAGKLLADQGAEVILVEPPDGHPSRRLAPYAPGSPDEVSSVTFAYFNGNKKSVVLPQDTMADRDWLRTLAPDVVLAGGRPSEIRAHGVNPEVPIRSIVYTTVTPYGWTGPYAEWAADDLTLQAMGGLMNMGGYHDGRPLRPPGRQAYVAAGIFAAIGTTAALVSRHATGDGQHVDVSVQESVTMALENSAQFYDFEGTVRRRHGGEQVQAGRGVYRCIDGYVYLMAGVRAEAKFWRQLLNWFDEDQTPGREDLTGEQWLQRDFVESEYAKTTFNRVFNAFCASKTKDAIYAGARNRGIPLAPVNDMADVLANEQLKKRDYFQTVGPAEWPHGPAIAPGAPYRMTATPWLSSYSPRRIGADAETILRDRDTVLTARPTHSEAIR